MKRNNTMIAAFTLPAAILFVAIFVYPVIRTVFMSFFSIQEITDSFSSWVFNGIGNYKALLANQLYRTSWSNLIKIFFIGGAITLGFSLLMAAILKSGVKFKGFWQAVIYMPNIVSAVAMATMWNQYVFNSTYGFLHNFFDALGMESLAKLQWLSPDMKFTALLVSYCFGTIGHYMLIWLSGMERISPDIYEAAGIDGANKLQQFRYVTMPLLRGIFKTNLTMWAISCSGFFIWSKLFSPVTADEATIVPMIYMYEKLFGSANTDNVTRDAGSAAAIGVMLCMFVVLTFFVVNKSIKNDDIEM